MEEEEAEPYDSKEILFFRSASVSRPLILFGELMAPGSLRWSFGDIQLKGRGVLNSLKGTMVIVWMQCLLLASTHPWPPYKGIRGQAQV